MTILDHHGTYDYPRTESAVLPVLKFALVWVGLLAVAYIINTTVSALL